MFQNDTVKTENHDVEYFITYVSRQSTILSDIDLCMINNSTLLDQVSLVQNNNDKTIVINNVCKDIVISVTSKLSLNVKKIISVKQTIDGYIVTYKCDCSSKKTEHRRNNAYDIYLLIIYKLNVLTLNVKMALG